MRIFILFPIVLMPLAALMLDSMACAMHLSAVDSIRNPAMRRSYQGAFYSYCEIAAIPAKWLLP